MFICLRNMRDSVTHLEWQVLRSGVAFHNRWCEKARPSIASGVLPKTRDVDSLCRWYSSLSRMYIVFLNVQWLSAARTDSRFIVIKKRCLCVCGVHSLYFPLQGLMDFWYHSRSENLYEDIASFWYGVGFSPSKPRCLFEAKTGMFNCSHCMPDGFVHYRLPGVVWTNNCRVSARGLYPTFFFDIAPF